MEKHLAAIIPSLTKGELLFLDRRKRGETQAQAAKRIGTNRYIYGFWERDEPIRPYPKTNYRCKEKEEIFIIIRRRAGLTQKQMAKKLKCSENWYRMMEKGQVDNKKLRKYWNG